MQKYFAYCTTENLDKMASWILSHYKSASVVFNDSKKEIDIRKYDFENKFKDKIIELNKMDFEIYEYARSNEKKFFTNNRDMNSYNSEIIAISNTGGKSFNFKIGRIQPRK